MIDDISWQPTAELQTLRRRATMLAAARRFFAARKVMEVETPILCAHSNSDVHIRSIQVDAEHGNLWLRTSPEYHMKRLLSAGLGDIYQIGRVFRSGESGSRHQPEFTMIEWYRNGFSMANMIHECCELIIELGTHGEHPVSSIQELSYRDAFLQTCDTDPFLATTEELQTLARTIPSWRDGLADALADDRSAWLDLIASNLVYPALPDNTLQVVYGYPADQAMLAALDPDNMQIAQRFEIFLNGLELANGFRELGDPHEQAQRFAQDNERRKAGGQREMPADPAMLAALAAGLPDCSGVAIGLDRVLMAMDRRRNINAVISFPVGS